MDAEIRQAERHEAMGLLGESELATLLRRRGLARCHLWDGYGDGYGNGNGSGDGNGYGSGNGSGNGDGDGYGYGYGYGYGKQGESMKHADYISLGSPVAIRSYVSGVFVGLLHGGEGGTVVLTNWRWLRRWEGVGNDGSVYDLVASDVTPQQRGPFTETPVILQQADVMVISDEAYERLVGETVQ